ncbi:MAG: hypothetical protein ACM3PT_11610 [Deltaproteobacteria bacterium]
MKSNKQVHKKSLHRESTSKEQIHHHHEAKKTNPLISKILPHFIALLAIFFLNVFYFFPAFSGKTLYQGDIVNHKGMAQEAVDHYKKTGEVTLWTNSMFSGMPTYQISAPQKNNLLNHVSMTLRLGFLGPQGYFILGMISFYIFLLVLGFNPWLSLIGSFAFSFMTNNMFLLEAGHNTKVATIMMGPLVLAGILLVLRKKYLIGGLIFTISMGLQFLANHVQMTYYLGIVIGILVIYEFIRFVIAKDFKAIGISTLIFVLGVILAVGSSASKLWTTYEYSKETMRGKPILKSEGEAKSSSETMGLEWSYAMNWSNGVMDLFSAFIPGVVGGGSGEPVSKDSEFAKKYRELAGSVPADLKAPLYWGALPFTSGPPYMGALVIFFFLFGMMTVRSRYKWWALISVVLLFLLSLGKNLEFFNKLFFDYFPLYNKFRTPNSIMGIAGIPLIFFSFYTIKHLLTDKFEKRILLRNLWITLGITGGISLFFATFGPSFFDFSAASDQQYAQYGFDKAFQSDRQSLMTSDSLRTFFIILLGAGLVWAWINKKLSKKILLTGIGIIVFFDILTVDLRYVNHKSFVNQKNIENTFTQREVDKQILQDPDPYYRVFDISVDPFNSAIPAYWHKNIGGYHAAKLQRYQDVIDRYISKNNMRIIDMLNTKYVIQKKDNAESFSVNPNAMGNAWLIDSIMVVDDANKELDAIGNTNVRSTAIVHKEFSEYVKSLEPDPAGEIKLTSYSPDRLEYKCKANGQAFAVFSEIWYGEKNAWKAYLDDKPVDFIRANFLLRGMKIPAGDHKIVFEFKPRSYIMGEKISLFSSLLMILLGAAYLFYIFYYKKRNA